jgi:hypothetical protein
MRKILTLLLTIITVISYGQRASTQQVVSGGGGGGTVTEVSSTNVNTLTVANPSSTPSLTIKTDTVSSSGTGLSTQKQIFDFVTTRNYLKRSEFKDSVATIKIPFVSDSVYDASLWDGNLNAASKNAIRDKIESISAGSSKWDSDTYGISYPSANIGVGNVSLTGFRFYSKASSGYSGLFEQTNVNASGLQIKMASSSNLYPSFHITDGSSARLSFYNNGFLELYENTTGILPGSSGFGRLYGSGGKIYYKNASNETFDLTSGSGGGMINPMTNSGDIIYGGASGTPTRLGIGSNGQVLMLSSGVPSWQTPSGTSKWTNDTYGINYQSGNVGIGGASSNTSALTVGKSVASGWGAVIQNTNSSTGSGLLVRSDVNNESYPVLRLNFGASNTMFTFLNNGHMAQRVVSSVPGDAPSNYGYWYVHSGKPYFKYGSTAYDLTTGSSYTLPTASSSTKGGVMIDASDGGLKMISDILALDINKLQTATPVSSDLIAISDVSDSYATRKTTISSLAALIGSGMSNPMTNSGDIIYGGASGEPARLEAGNNGQILTLASGVPTWQNAAPGSSMVYPGSGIANSTGSSWGTSFSTSGTGTVVALTNTPTLTTPTLAATASGTTAGRLGYSGGVLSFGNGTNQKTLVTTDDTQTLTGKTISGANNTLTVRLNTSDVNGNLPVTNLDSGTGASGSTFWRGDGTWANPGTSSNWVNSGSNVYINSYVGINANPDTDFRLLITENSSTKTPLSVHNQSGQAAIFTGTRNNNAILSVQNNNSESGSGITASGTGYGIVGSATHTGVYGGGETYDFYAGGSGTDYGSASSRRWKNNIRPIPNALSKLDSIRGVYFTWDEQHGNKDAVGFIAEEVGQVLPEIVVYETNGVDAQGMDYSKITPLLLQAIKELNQKVQELEARIQALENDK